MSLEARVAALEVDMETVKRELFGTAVQHKVGWHLGNTIPLGDGQKRDIRKVPPAMCVFITHEHIGKPQLEWIKREVRDDCLFVFRPYFVPSDSLAAYQAYENKCIDMLTWHNGWDFLEDWQCFLQPYNEPNMPHKMPDGSINTQWEGFGTQRQAIARYNERFCIVHDRAKATNPRFKTVVMNLTPGNHDVFFPTGAYGRAAVMAGERNRIGPDGDLEYWMADIQPMDAVGEHYYMHGPQSAKPSPTPQEIKDSIDGCLCRDALLRADVLGAHIYVVNGGPAIDARWLGRRFVQQAQFLPKAMPILITECGIGGDFSGIRSWYDHIHDCNGQDAEHPNVLATGWWRLGFEVRDGPLVEALHNYIQKFNGDPPTPPEPPVPDFTAEPRSGVAPLEVKFTNLSDKDGVGSFRWFFLDQHQDAENWHPAHTFEKPGYYRIILRLWPLPGEQGQPVDMKKDGYINVLAEEPPVPAPEAAFDANPLSGEAPLTVVFTDTSTGEIDEWYWDFGDGYIEYGQNPSHIYTVPGNYTVKLTVTGSGGTDSLERVDYISVAPKPVPTPEVAFEASPTYGSAPLLVVFTDLSIGEITFWEWDFGDGTTSNKEHPTHTYTAPGKYNVSLMVRGPGGTDFGLYQGYIEVVKPLPKEYVIEGSFRMVVTEQERS